MNIGNMRYFFIFCLLACAALQQSCSSSYSFTGASISPEVQTVSVRYFNNVASLTPPTESQKFTEALRDIFLSQTSLTLVENHGDLQFEGQIVDYRTDPVAIQSNDEAALTRLSVSVKVKFTNEIEPKKSFEQTFTRYEDYQSSLNLSLVEEDLLRSINEQLVQDIFNRSVTDW